MATNIKFKDSVKYKKHLTLDDRNNLNNFISSNRNLDGSLSVTLKEIAEKLQKDPTTLSKEVKSRRETVQTCTPYYSSHSSYCNSCVNSKDCKLKKEYINSCLVKKNYSTIEICKSFKKKPCPHVSHFPWVCNGCKKKAYCGYTKYYYQPLRADKIYKSILFESRTGINMTQEEFDKLEAIMQAGLEKNKKHCTCLCN